MSQADREAISAGDVVRDSWPKPGAAPRVNLYLGSGRCGACFNAWGLMHARARDDDAGHGIGNTFLMHAEHFRRDGTQAPEHWVPLARMTWAADDEPAPPQLYRQHLALFDGRLTTEMAWPGLDVSIAAQFDPSRRDVLGIEMQYEASGEVSMPALQLCPAGEFTATGPTSDGMHYSATVRGGSADTLLALNVVRREGQSEIHPMPGGARVEFTGRRGRHLLLVGAGATTRGGTIADDLTAWNAGQGFAESASAAWHKLWDTTELPAGVPPGDRAMWARSLFYCLCSYAPESHAPAPSHGWSGNGPLSHDPRGTSEIAAALLDLGHADVARALVEHYRGRFAAGRRYDGETAGAVAKMARDVSAHAGDAAWSRQVAWPIVHETARHFASLLKPAPGGMWTLDDPALAEWARQCLRDAVAMAGELGVSGQEYANYRGVLSDGIVEPDFASRHESRPRDFASDAEHIQFFSPTDPAAPYHLPTHAAFLNRFGVTRNAASR